MITEPLASPRPQWIAEMERWMKSGLDHLGVGSVSTDQILPTLSPNVFVLTVHPRYVAFYSFLLDEYWRTDRKRSRAHWVQFYRPREVIFSIGAILHEDARHVDVRNIIGSRKTTLLATERRTSYATDFDYMDSDLGGFGLYYRSQMAQLGMLYPGGPGYPYPVDVLTERGREVASRFREAVERTEYYKDYFQEDDTEVPIEVIREYIGRACLCQLPRDDAPDRSILRDVYLHNGRDPETQRDTFRMLLDLASQTDGSPLDREEYRRLLFYQSASDGRPWIPVESVREIYAQWRMYQAREYYNFALNALWNFLCTWGIHEGGDRRPIPMSRTRSHFEHLADVDRLAEWLELSPPGLSPETDLRRLFAWLREELGRGCDDFGAPWDLLAKINEDRLIRLASDRSNRGRPELMVTGMLLVLAMLYVRLSPEATRAHPAWRIARSGQDGRLSMDGFLHDIEARLARGRLTIGQTMRWILSDYVIQQHLVVASRKLPDNTFRFMREAGGLRFIPHDNALTMLDPRFDALSTTLHELGLCDDMRQSEHPLTDAGRALLVDGGLP